MSIRMLAALAPLWVGIIINLMFAGLNILLIYTPKRPRWLVWWQDRQIGLLLSVWVALIGMSGYFFWSLS